MGLDMRIPKCCFTASQTVSCDMKPKVYIETTVVSYYTAWPSRDLVVAGRQEV